MTPVLIGKKRPSFGGLKPQNRGQTGSRLWFFYKCLGLKMKFEPILNHHPFNIPRNHPPSIMGWSANCSVFFNTNPHLHRVFLQALTCPPNLSAWTGQCVTFSCALWKLRGCKQRTYIGVITRVSMEVIVMIVSKLAGIPRGRLTTYLYRVYNPLTKYQIHFSVGVHFN